MTTASTNVDGRALFDRLPRLVDLVPFLPLADGLPTRVERVDEHLWVKRDDETVRRPDRDRGHDGCDAYGGNKVRKLEFVLPVAARRGGPLLTAGGVGSHHVLAAAVYARRLGLAVEAVVFPQPETDDVARTRAALAAIDGVRITAAPHAYAMPLVLAARLAALAPRRPYLLWPGASTPLGTLGYVSAGLELAQQMPEPDVVVAPLGSGGTAVGLALGLTLAGWRRARVVAVRAADAVVTNIAVLRSLEAGTAALLALGGWRPRPAQLVVERGYFGAGYGHPTDAGADAAVNARHRGIDLEPTYTAKAYAAALDRAARGERVAFVLTFAGDRTGGTA